MKQEIAITKIYASIHNLIFNHESTTIDQLVSAYNKKFGYDPSNSVQAILFICITPTEPNENNKVAQKDALQGYKGVPEYRMIVDYVLTLVSVSFKNSIIVFNDGKKTDAEKHFELIKKLFKYSLEQTPPYWDYSQIEYFD